MVRLGSELRSPNFKATAYSAASSSGGNPNPDVKREVTNLELWASEEGRVLPGAGGPGGRGGEGEGDR